MTDVLKVERLQHIQHLQHRKPLAIGRHLVNAIAPVSRRNRLYPGGGVAGKILLRQQPSLAAGDRDTISRAHYFPW